MHWKKYYQAPVTWQGRMDSAVPERLHQFINTMDLTKTFPEKSGVVICGFCCDAGIKRNQGRVGAKAGPAALRAALSSLPFDTACALYDVGDIVCDDDDLENAQAALSEMLALLFKDNHSVIVLGGGHEIAWGHYQGIINAFPTIDLGIINFDAHYDLRPLLPNNQGSSGTPFLQIANVADKQFSYTCIGIQPFSNTQSLCRKASELNVKTILANEVDQKALTQIETVLQQHQGIYLTLCLDVFAQAVAPGVSAPTPVGLLPHQVISLLKRIAQHTGPVFFDIAELSPPYDRDNMTAKLAAYCVIEFLNAIVKSKVK